MDFTGLGVAEIKTALAKKEFSAKELLGAYLARIEKNNPALNAYLEIFAEEAGAAAAASDRRIAAGEPLRALEGVPIAIKDNLLYRGHLATAGSKILAGYSAPYTATALEKILEAGAIILGRTNMDEFAMGSSTENSAYGPTKNPYDLERVPGGSSGGSAVAVSADLAAAALGSDTGGSIRQPAALSGVVGLKPTYGRVSRYGLMAMASSLDQIGPFAKNAADAGLMLQALEGEDRRDSTSVKASPTVFEKRADLRGVKIGVPKEYIEGLNDLPIGPAIDKAIEKLKELGAELREVSLPHAPYALALYYVLMPAEVSSNLARFDGIRFGPRESAKNLRELYKETRGRLFGEEARRRIMLGTFVLSAGYYDAYYKKAQEARTLVSADYAKAFSEVDLLVTPTSPTTAWKLGEKMDDPLAMYLADVDTVSVNAAGLPAISIPSGLLDGLPVGLQFIGPRFGEGAIISAAIAAERAFGFREKNRPEI